MNKPLVSIITVALNSEKTISETIESVLAQTYKNIEYIIVDGVSTDNTVEIALGYAQRFAEMGVPYTVISEKDKGIFDAMNKGISMAKGDIVGLINSNDWYEPCAAEVAANAFMNYGCDFFYGDLRIIKEDKSTTVKKATMKKFPSSRHWNHPTTFVSKVFYNDNPYRCQGTADDFDLYLRAIRSGAKIHFENKILANFSMGGISNQKNLKKVFKRIGVRYKVYRDNGYSPLVIFECVMMEFAKLILS